MARARMLPSDPRHGTVNGYNNLHCRCERCVEAWSVFSKIRRSGARNLAPDDPRHGTPSGYHYWSCRCELCRAGEAKNKLRSRGKPMEVSTVTTPAFNMPEGVRPLTDKEVEQLEKVRRESPATYSALIELLIGSEESDDPGNDV